MPKWQVGTPVWFTDTSRVWGRPPVFDDHAANTGHVLKAARTVSQHDQLLSPSFSFEGALETMGLMGEPALVTDRRESWLQCALPEQPTVSGSYLGWVEARHLTIENPEVDAVITARTTEALVISTGATVSLRMGERLRILRQLDTGQVEVKTPAGISALVRADLVQPAGAPAGQEALLSFAQEFIGVSYLWGGMDANGIDCSGLTHIVARMCGLRIPRNADDQATIGNPSNMHQPGNGDLLFFSSDGRHIDHVGLAVNGRYVLHASAARGKVVVQAIASVAGATLVSSRTVTTASRWVTE